ncbi:MAG: CHASE2 domain-containing protein [Chloroflexota bacterium]
MQPLSTWLWNFKTRIGFGAGLLTAVFILIMWLNGFFTQSQLRLNDLFFVSADTTNHIVIIALDDATHNVYGRSLAAWPRTVYANLINTLNQDQARVIAFDILFDQPSDQDQSVVDAIVKARQSDTRTRFIMPQVGANQTISSTSTHGSDIAAIHFNNTLVPIPAFTGVVDYVGYVNAFTDVDSEVRRQISLVDNHGTNGISFDIAAYLAWLRIPSAATSQVIKSESNHLQVASISIPVDEHGLWQQNFFGAPSSTSQNSFPVYSALDVINGSIPASAFQDKLVLVGLMNTTAATDLYPVPSSLNGQLMAGVEIHAHAIESLLQNKIPSMQSRLSQAIMIASLALVSSLIYAHLKWYWMLPAAALMLALLFIIGSVRFSSQLEFINLFYSTLALIIPLIINVFAEVSLEFNRRNKAEFLLESAMEVSSQRMVIDRILPSVAGDIQRVLKATTGAIWLVSDPPRLTNPQHTWGNADALVDHFQQLATRVQHDQQSARDQDYAAVPVIWKKHLIAILAVQFPSKRNFIQIGSRLRLLKSLAEHVAPNLDNAALYTRTQEQNTLLEAVLGGSPAAIMVLEPDLKIIKLNKASGGELAEAGDIALGTSFVSLLNRVGIDTDTQESIGSDFQTYNTFRKEIKVGKKVFNLDAAKLDFGDWVVILNDVTALAEVSRLKTQMVRMTSHDLKKPLSRVLGYGSLLLDDDKESLNVQQRQYLQRMFRAGEEMLELINDILDLEQLRSSHIKTKLVSVQSVLKEVIERYQPDMEGKKQTLQQDITPDLPEVVGDPLLLSQALSNLVENAIKYTPEAGTITTRLCQQKSYIRIEIEDTGFGIPESAQSQLFQEFYRVRSRDTANIGGTGLGLSLVRSIAEAHNGRIGVKSQEGVGSTFFIELPMPQES